MNGGKSWEMNCLIGRIYTEPTDGTRIFRVDKGELIRTEERKEKAREKEKEEKKKETRKGFLCEGFMFEKRRLCCCCCSKCSQLPLLRLVLILSGVIHCGERMSEGGRLSGVGVGVVWGGDGLGWGMG